MRKDRQAERSFKVCVLHLEVMPPAKERYYRGTFLIIFDEGETISKETSLFVFWREKGKRASEFDYIMPRIHQQRARLAIEKKAAKEKRLNQKLKNLPPSKLTENDLHFLAETTESDFAMLDKDSIILFQTKVEKEYPYAFRNLSLFDLEVAIENGGGRWKKFSKGALNSNLRKKYVKRFDLIKALSRRKVPPKSPYSDIQSLSTEDFRSLLFDRLFFKAEKIPFSELRLVNNDCFALSSELVNKPPVRFHKTKSALTIDPLGVVRNFLVFVGFHREARGRKGSQNKR